MEALVDEYGKRCLEVTETRENIRGVHAGVQVRFLESLVQRFGEEEFTTAEIVERLVVPATKDRVCRFVALVEPRFVGRASVFVSHTWCGSFRNLVAAISHVLEEDQFVWIDIFAVLQHVDGLNEKQFAEKDEELRFDLVVGGTNGLLLFSEHMDELANVSFQDARDYRIPDEILALAQRRCAFFRVWCLVEIVAAHENGIPIVMLVGSCDRKTREFIPNISTLGKLYHILDVTKAASSFEEDRTRILKAVEEKPGIENINTVCKGAVQGATFAMSQKHVLRATLSFLTHYLDELVDVDALGDAFCAAAAGGFLHITQALLERRDEFDIEHPDHLHQNTALGNAASGGHVAVCKALIEAGADLEARNKYKYTALMEAAAGGHHDTVALLVSCGADMNATSPYGLTAFLCAIRSGNLETVQTLANLGANIHARNIYGDNAVDIALKVRKPKPFIQTIRTLLKNNVLS